MYDVMQQLDIQMQGFQADTLQDADGVVLTYIERIVFHKLSLLANCNMYDVMQQLDI